MNSGKILSLSLLLTAGFSSSIYAQDITDALRYSYLSPMGTARSVGFGNALGSVGGDFSSLSVNPAGIGIYRTSEIMLTPALRMNSVDATYQGNGASDNNTRFNFNNVGVVFSNGLKGRRYERSKWKAVSFGIGFNRLADFNRDYHYSGNNSGTNSSSYSELFAIDADNGEKRGLAASDVGIIDSPQGVFRTVVPWQAGINQQRIVSERGGLNEVVISFGGNYMEHLMLGATVGIPIINYSRDAQVTETALNSTPNFYSYTYSEGLTTHGDGINLKLGAIYKFNDYFRIGAAIHTPTYYSMHDEVAYTLNNSGVGAESFGSTYDYNLTTPWRGVLSATGMIGKYGFISADYEYVDYSSTRFTFDVTSKDLERQVNDDIKSAYKPASIFRLGAEGRVTKNFMLRAGFGYYGSPAKNSSISDNRIDISGGVGFRFDHFYIDLAYVHTQFNGQEQFYQLNYTDATGNPYSITQNASMQSNLSTAVMTIGFKF
ncbi:MAG: outer membrane protein transport protein [Bacteroidetes bacterium]|nr:outer membrane protein transport protein [Bacteroidota bacterium]